MKKSIFLFASAIVIASATIWLSACHQEKNEEVSSDPSAVEERSNGNSKVFPPSASPHGKSYADWTAKWWQEMMTFDCANNPWLNSDNVLFYQTGPVYFLAGLNTPGASVNVTVPHGKAILFPLTNYINDYPCPPEYNFEPVPPQTLEEFLTEGATAFTDGVTGLAVEVDGASVSNPGSYVFISDLFYFTGTPELPNCFDVCVTGASQPAVSGGFFMMLKPLAKGTHTVHYHSEIPAWNSVQDGTFNITVQ